MEQENEKEKLKDKQMVQSAVDKEDALGQLESEEKN